MDAAIHFAAHKVGLGALKPKQVEVIKAFASGSDVLYPYPRGTGSPFATFCSRLCLISSLGEVVRLCCISPLTSLMMEQRSKFSELGLCCRSTPAGYGVHGKRPELCSTTFCSWKSAL